MGVVKCVGCGTKVHDEVKWCPECGHDPRTGAPSPVAVAAEERREAAEVIVGDCPSCGGALRKYGTREFALHGAGAGAHFLLGDLAHLGDQSIALEIEYCRDCRHVEFRFPEGAG